MWRYFSLVLCMPDPELTALRKAVETGQRHPRDVKDELGRRIVAKFFDEKSGEEASGEFKRIFAKNSCRMKFVGGSAPDAIQNGRVGILTVLVQAGLASSNSEARRLVQQGAVDVDGQRAQDPRADIDYRPGSIIRCGKRGFVRIA